MYKIELNNNNIQNSKIQKIINSLTPEKLISEYWEVDAHKIWNEFSVWKNNCFKANKSVSVLIENFLNWWELNVSEELKELFYYIWDLAKNYREYSPERLKDMENVSNRLNLLFNKKNKSFSNYCATNNITINNSTTNFIKSLFEIFYNSFIEENSKETFIDIVLLENEDRIKEIFLNFTKTYSWIDFNWFSKKIQETFIETIIVITEYLRVDKINSSEIKQQLSNTKSEVEAII